MPGVARIPVRLPDGSTGTVPASEAADLPEGSETLSADEARAEKRSAQYGGALDKGAAASFGALRSFSGGLSDHAAIGLARAVDGDDGATRLREAMTENAEEHPGYTAAGELAGLIAPALLTGGSSGAARALGGYGAAVGKAGAVAEGLAARAFGTGARSLGARALQKGAITAVGAGTEASLLGAQREVSEAALGDHDLVAEHMMTTMAGDFLAGAALGGALGAGGELVKEGGRRALASAFGKTGDETVAAALQRKSGELYYKAAGPTQKMAMQAEQRVKGGTAALGNTLREEVETALGRPASSRADLAEAFPKIKERGGKIIDDALERLDAAAQKHGRVPTAEHVFRQVHDEVLLPLAQNTAGGAAEGAVRAWAQRTGKILGLVDDVGKPIAGAETKALTYRQIQKLRREVDDLSRWNATTDTTTTSSFKGIRSILEGHVEKGVETLGGLSGDAELARDYLRGKQVYQAGRELEKAASRGVAQNKTNRLLSLTDNIIGAAGASVGGSVAGAPGAFVGGALAAGVNHVIRQKFDLVASDILAKAAQLGTISRISAESEQQLAAGVRGFLRRGAGTSAAVAGDVFGGKRGEARGAAYLRMHARLSQAVSDPERQIHAVSSYMGDAAPRTTASLGTKLATGLAWLHGKLPPPVVDPYHLQQHLEKPEPPDADDLDAAERYVRAFQHPKSVLHDMQRGEVSPEAVDTVKNVYPRIYDKIVEQIDRELADPSTPELDWDQQVQLELLFDRPTDELLVPEAMADIQNVYAAHAAASPGGGAGTGSVGRDSRATRNMQTAAQRIEGG